MDKFTEKTIGSKLVFDGMVSKGQIDDAKTLAAWLLYKTKAGV